MLRNTVESVRSRCQREIGSFSRKMPQQRVGQAQIALGVFEVDRIDLVRHRQDDPTSPARSRCRK